MLLESFLSMRDLIIVRSRSERLGDYLLLAALVASLLVSAFFILRDSGRPLPHPMDQSFILSADLRLGRSNGNLIFRYPNLMFSGGVASNIIVGLYKFLIPTNPENINWHIRIFTTTCYLGSSFLLIRQLIDTTALRLLALTMFGLAKVEFIVASVVLASFWWLWEHRRGNPHAVWAFILTVTWLGLLLLPSLFVTGSNLDQFDRSMGSFMFTYVELSMPHQFSPSTQSVDQVVEQLKAGQFRESTSIFKFITQNPGLYLGYLGLSAVKGLPFFLHSFKLMLIPMASVVLLKAQRVRPLLLLLLLAALFTLLPAWLLSYVRIRYLVKFFPAFITLAIAGCEELGASRPWVNITLWVSGIGTIFWQLIYFNDIWAKSHYL